MKLGLINPRDVYDLLTLIPAGKVTTYGDIARALEYPNASRMIGRILNKNPTPVIIPCHRVIMSDGKIGGYVFGKMRKKELLKKEGLCFLGDRIINLAKYRIAVEKIH
jgi:methylated-DNA-[protein]-cysteine S-methyltransferase